MSTPHGLIAAVDENVDYEETAALANEAFGGSQTFSAAQLRWLYEQSFSQGSTVVSLRAGGRKVGQFVMLKLRILSQGVAEHAVQLIDLFILEKYRSREALTRLYGEVEAQCIKRGVRFAIGMPNTNAASANTFFFKLNDYRRLDIRAGVALPLPASGLKMNETFQVEHRVRYLQEIRPFETSNSSGVPWTADGLVQRLTSPQHRYGLHIRGNVLLVSSPRLRRGLSYTLLCGFFNKGEASPIRKDVLAVIRAACGLWRRPLHMYPGIHDRLSRGAGIVLPDLMRPSAMLIQLRDFQPHKPQLDLQRYQALDFDFG